MRARAVVLVVALLALSGCDVLFPDVPEPNLTGLGPRATEAAVEINYPVDAPALPARYADLAATWNGLVETDGRIGLLPTDPSEELVVAESDLSGVLLDVARDRDDVSVAQLFIQKGSRDEDSAVVDLAILAFIQAATLEDGPIDSTRMALGIGDNPFVINEGAAVLGGVQLWVASNEDSLLLGAVGR